MGKAHRVVIVGAGFGGLVTALQLAKRQKERVEIILIDQKDRHVYTPWLYDVAANLLVKARKDEVARLAKTAAFSVKHILAAKQVKGVRFRKAHVTSIDPKTQHVLLKGGKTVAYDSLVLSAGTQENFFGVQGVEAHALPLKGVDQAMNIREKIAALFKQLKEDEDRHGSIVIVGGGPTGTETASELGNFLQAHPGLAFRARVVLIDSSERLLSGLSPFAGGRARSRLESLGVDVHTETLVTKVDKKDVHATKRNKETLKIPYDVLVWAAGVQPRPLVHKGPFKATKGGRLQVNRFLQVDGYKNVYAIGDCAACVDAWKRTLPPTAWAAVEQGKYLGKSLDRWLRGKTVQPFKTPRHWPAVVTIGGGHAVAEVAGMKFSGFLAFLLRRVVDLRYFLLIFPTVKAITLWRQGSVLLAKND